MEHITDRNSDIIFVTETWLQSDKNSVTAEAKTYGYKMLHDIRKDREKDRGGGVGILIKSIIVAKQLPVKHFTSLEHTIVKIPGAQKRTLYLICIYRLQWVSTALFIEEVAELFDQYAVPNEDFVIAGDVNLHMETESLYVKQFKDLLDLHDLKQHVSEPTHVKGHTLDIVITPNKVPYVLDVHVTEIDLSHHFLIDFKVLSGKEKKQVKEITYRSLCNVDMLKFREDVQEKLGALPTTNNLGAMVDSYNSALREIVDASAPLKTTKIKIVEMAPWFDREYADLRKERRRAEKKYHRTRLEADKKVYTALRREAINTSFDKKKEYISKRLEKNPSKNLYSVVNELTDNKKVAVLPNAISDKELADNFMTFFCEKIEKIRASFIPVNAPRTFVVVDNCPEIVKLSEFEPATLEEITEIAKSYGIKCSPEDPVPATLLSSNIDLFAPYWLEIVNLSLAVGSMDKLKEAVLNPLIKELNSLTDTEKYNYRPVSNLVFVSKLIERVVQKRLEQHMISNQLHTDKNYAYRSKHAVEHLLLKVINDLYLSFDKNIPSVVVLLDLSAAFDTVDHAKLLYILEHEIGIVGTALKWFKSFLKGRTQKVKIGDEYSNIVELMYGVAQGSVLGPPLLKIYIRSLYKHVEPTRFTIEGFADDHQLIKQFMITFQQQALGESIQKLLQHIGEWMMEYFLCLNKSKTKILVLAPPSVQPEIVIGGVFLENVCIRFVTSAKNLGVILDNVLSFEEQINKVIKACYATLKKLTQIKGFLSQQQLQQLVSSDIFSHLDYCNSLYYGINNNLIMKLQRVQNCAARLVCKEKIGHNMMDKVMMNLHWLKVKFRCLYKILLIVHNCLHQNAPNELIELLQYADSERTMNLRESSYSNKYGARSFSHVAPKLWNLLPLNIRDIHETIAYKKALKSFLMVRGEEFLLWIKRR